MLRFLAEVTSKVARGPQATDANINPIDNTHFSCFCIINKEFEWLTYRGNLWTFTATTANPTLCNFVF